MNGTSHVFWVLSAIEITAAGAVTTAVLSFTLSSTFRGRIRAAAVIAGWFLMVVVFGATGALDGQTGAGTAGLAAAVLLPIAVLCYAFLVHEPTRDAVWRTPMEVLIAVNILRVLGISFVLLYSAHELAAPFAPVAGWGDVLVGLTAGPVAWIAARYGARAKGWVLAWNILGFMDLITAVGLGATSAPGPIRLFMDPPGSAIMTSLPWIIIPCFLVPALEALHVAIFSRVLSRTGPRRAEVAAQCMTRHTA